MEQHTAAASFPITRWSVVLEARRENNPAQSRTALEQLCQQYWFPLYAFARRRGHSPADAEDRTQSFFAELLSARLFNAADPTQGRMRTFLLTAFQRHLADQHRHDHAQKRGGVQQALSIDADAAEDLLRIELATNETPESVFEIRWAVALLDSAMSTLEQEYLTAGKPAHFKALRPFLTAAQSYTNGYEEAACELAMTNTAARQAVHRMRQRFRQVLRACVADTLKDSSPQAVDEELAALKLALARSGI